jgi:hypothetical protein
MILVNVFVSRAMGMTGVRLRRRGRKYDGCRQKRN